MTSQSTSSTASFASAVENHDGSSTLTLSNVYVTAQSTLLDVGTSARCLRLSDAGHYECSTVCPDSSLPTPAGSILKLDSAAAHKKFLPRMMEIIAGMGAKTSDGVKITSETFFDAQKLTSEVVQRVIIMLLVKFGFMGKEEARNDGLPMEDYKPLEGAYFKNAGVEPPRTDFTLDDLHTKILRTFFRNADSDLVDKYYDASVLSFPELNPMKTRTALSYFTHFCIIARELAKQEQIACSIALEKSNRDIELRKKIEALRAQIEEQERVAAQLGAELQEELRKHSLAETENMLANKFEDCVDAAIEEAENALKELFQSHERQEPVVASSSKSKAMSRQAQTTQAAQGSSFATAPAKTRHSKGENERSCRNSECEETRRRHQEMAAKIALAQGRNMAAEQVIGRCEALMSRLRETKSDLEKAMSRQKMEEVSLQAVKAIIVQVNQIEQEIKASRKRHEVTMEGMRFRLAVKEGKLMRRKEETEELDKKLEDMMHGLSLEVDDSDLYAFMNYRDPSNKDRDLDQSHN